jgi:hypothetical protein
MPIKWSRCERRSGCHASTFSLPTTPVSEFEGRMFVFGGEAPAGTFNQVQAYDGRSNGWSNHARMPTARHGLGAAAVAGRIYVISGGPTPGDSVSGANEIFVP